MASSGSGPAKKPILELGPLKGRPATSSFLGEGCSDERPRMEDVWGALSIQEMLTGDLFSLVSHSAGPGENRALQFHT